ncbi:MAG: phosphatidylglycerophosphatase A [bacterium]
MSSPPRLLDRFTLLVATWFGLGYAPVASGTFGALPGALIAYVVAVLSLHSGAAPAWQVAGQVAFALVLSGLAVPVCDAAEQMLGTKDDGRIVADETLTFPVCTIGLPLVTAPWMLAVAFVVNRVCDIIKPPPARRLQDLHGGVGIVIDDFIACLYALAINHAIYWSVAWHGACLFAFIPGMASSTP